jgi:hypothetical protein
MLRRQVVDRENGINKVRWVGGEEGGNVGGAASLVCVTQSRDQFRT